MDLHNIMFNDDELDEILILINGIPRHIYNRAQYFESFDDLTFYQRFRISKETVLLILNEIEAYIEYPYDMNNSVSPVNQLLIFLRFCATGTHLACIGDFSGTHLSTVSRIVVRVGRALARLYQRYVRMPNTRDEIIIKQLGFYEIARFPRTVGVMDGTHIRIQSPGGDDAEIFRNRKGYFSINVQAVADAHSSFMDVVARWPGSTHDATIFNNCRLRQEFDNNVYPNSLLLGDSGYNLRPYVMTPLLNPQTRPEQLYNESHIRTRNTIERTFGIWKRRFPVLAYGCRLKLDTVLIVIIATAVLQNICVLQNELPPPDPEDIARFVNVLEEDDVPNVPIVQNQIGYGVRQDLIQNYFSTLDE